MFRSAVVPGRRSRASRLLTATGVSLALTIGVVSATPLAASAAPAGLPKPYLGKVVTGHGWKPGATAKHAATSVTPPAPTVMSASSTTVALPTGPVSGIQPQTRAQTTHSVPAASVAGTWQAVGTQGLAVAAAQEVNGGKQAASNVAGNVAAGKVVVDVLDAAAAKKYGAPGLAVRLRRADGGSGAAPVAVAVPVKLLTGLYGADYASRVRWIEYPDTGTRPSGAEILAVPVTTAGSNAVLSPQVASGSAMMLTAAASPTSSAGTGSFAATDLQPAGAWQVSAQSGDFSWSYPLRVPPAAAGPVPGLSLSYDSQAVDGETGSTNNQPSAVGDGWSMAGGGFVERSYIPCALDTGSTGPVTSSGDLCWKTDNATLNLGGHTSQLVKDSASGVWKLAADGGSRLEHLTGAGNGAQGGEYWRLTTTDGTQYYFGLGQLPGWTAGAPTTNSTWTVPVYGNDPGEPCHAASFAASSCTQGWRWNLDYVVDPHGNADASYYTAETNLYAQNGSGGASYVRGGRLDHIDYGLTSATIYAANAASDKVAFGYSDRCVSTTGCDSAHPTNWPDVPWDQNCTAAPCTQIQPTFWSTKMLSSVSTQYWTGTTYNTVDTWALGHSFPDPGDGTTAALWLTGITHTGNAGTTPITLPGVTFAGATMQNRVWAIDGLAPLDKYRITSLTAETGAVTSVNYSSQQCTAANAPTIEANANTNTQRCFPQWWTPQTVPPQPAKLDLFHKYVVTSVISDPRTGGANDRPQETDYLYTGTPAWRYDSSPLTPDSQRTWSVYAGYNTVEVRVGDPTTPSTQQTSDYLFFRGLDGDRAATTGGTKSVTVTAGDGSSVPDSRWLAGRTRETKTLNGVGGSVLSDALSTAWASAVTANDGTTTARMVADGDVVSTTPLAAGGTRRTETVTSYDGYGRPTQVNAITPDAGTTCTTTSYTAVNTSAWLIDYPAEIAVVGKDCAATPAYPGDAISDTRTAYDGGAVGAAPSKGDPTTTQIVKDYTGNTAASAVWLTTATTGYDTLGRVTSVTDPRTGTNRSTTTTYTPATGGPVTQTVATNPLGWTATSAYNPAWGAQTSATDVNGHTSTATYDALGRRTAAWAPDRPQASNPTPNLAYAYTVSTGGPLSVTTTALTASGGTATSWALYDGLGRPRQTQAPAEGAGGASSALITDTYYDPAGRAGQHNQQYFTNSVAPSGTLFVPTSTIPGQELLGFDGAGRTLTDAQWVNGAPAWQTAYAYPGADRTDMTPPAGGTPTTTWTNSTGKTTKLIDYLAAAPSPTAQQEATSYSYDPAGRMTGMTDPAGNTWSWAFDTLGRQTSATDPDTGTTTTGYDDAGRATTTTDARGTVQASSYDALDRTTALNQTNSSGPLLAAWTYDTLAKGQLTSSASYVGSTPGTPGAAYTQAVTGYDAANRPTGHATTLPAGTPMAGTYTTTLSYTASGAPQNQSIPAEGGIPAEALGYSYDALGNIAGVSGTISGGSFIYAGAFTYTYLGQIANYMQSRASQKFYRYFTHADGTNRLTELKSLTSNTAVTTTADRHYSYDNAGNVTGLNTTADTTATDTQCFTYDPLRELTAAWTPASNNCATTPASSALGGPAPYWISYNYDPATGNRTGSVEHATTGGGNDTTDTSTYPAAGQPHPHAVTTVAHTTGASTTTSSYGTPDAAGNTLTRPGQTLAYDARGNLGTVTLTANGQQQTSIYDADGNLLTQTDPTTGTTAYLGDTELHQAPGTSTVTATRTYTLNGTPVAERDTTAGVTGSTLYFLDPDHLGTATVEDKATTGTVTRRYQDPYGNPRGPATTWASPHGYLNAPTSTFSGLTHLGARNYDPTLGRLTTVDPLLSPDNPQQNNGYTYAWNNPTTFSDPSGLKPLGQCDGDCRYAYSGAAGTGATTSGSPPAPGATARQLYMGGSVAETRLPRDKYIDAQTGANNGLCLCHVPHIFWTPDPGFGNWLDFWGPIIDLFAQKDISSHLGANPKTGTAVLGKGVAVGLPFLAGVPEADAGEGAVALGEAAGARAGAGAAETGDHIVLGLRAHGLEGTAVKVGGRTLLNDADWMASVQRGVANPSTKFTVSLDGMSGSSTYSQVMGGAQRGLGGAGSYTDWEMAQLYQGGRLADTTLVRGGQVVENPFGP